MESCTIGKVLGTGTFGVVYKGYHRGKKKVVAIKSVDLKDTKRSQRRKQREKLKREVDILKECSHQNIVQFVDFLQDGDSRFLLIMQFYGGGNLRRFMDEVLKRQPMEEAAAQLFAKQLTSGLFYLHSRKPAVIHRNLKPSNVFMSEMTPNATLYIGDFGEANIKSTMMKKPKLHTLAGTPMYMAPEVLSGEDDDDDLEYRSNGELFFFFSELIHFVDVSLSITICVHSLSRFVVDRHNALRALVPETPILSERN